ncbi:unnamed protein product [Nezara viridula]|uniref:Uncharacterized protein n=1 Tax=Nezara viridula TaxID=85310 RepID=A0A9P0HAH5_NEZVI|nr:unnamed protein product [Nezara viridula]
MVVETFTEVGVSSPRYFCSTESIFTHLRIPHSDEQPRQHSALRCQPNLLVDPLHVVLTVLPIYTLTAFRRQRSAGAISSAENEMINLRAN